MPGARNNPLLVYYNNYIYMMSGIAEYNPNPYTPEFFRYNIAAQLWENITNPESIYTFRYNTQARASGDQLFLFPGLDEFGNIENSIWRCNLSDPTFA